MSAVFPEPASCLLQAFRDADGCAQQLLEPVSVQQGSFDVAWPDVSEADFAGALQDLLQLFSELQGVGFDAGADIQDGVGDQALHGSQVGFDDVGDIDVVAHAAGIAGGSAGKHADGFCGQHAVAEDRNDSGFTVGVLSWSVDVGVAEDGGVQAMLAAKGLEVFFDGKFAAGVGALGHGGW